jgi:hypothetical protein
MFGPSSRGFDTAILLGVFALFTVKLVVEINVPLKDDVAWLLHVASNWIDSHRLYVSLIELNPPPIIWLSALPVLLGRPRRKPAAQRRGRSRPVAGSSRISWGPAPISWLSTGSEDEDFPVALGAIDPHFARAWAGYAPIDRFGMLQAYRRMPDAAPCRSGPPGT